jgi:hypothetical protein
MSNCTQFENKIISRTTMEHLWNDKVTKAALPFLKSNKYSGKDLKQNATDSAQGTYLELHTWYPYENSDRCNPTEGTVPVKVFTVRNLSDIRRSDIFRGYIEETFHGCSTNVYVKEFSLILYSTRHIWYNDKKDSINATESKVELVKVIRKALNMTPHINNHGQGTDDVYLYVGKIPAIEYTFNKFYHI